MNNFHIILNHIYTKPYVEFVKENFDISKHKFCIYGRWSNENLIVDDVRLYHVNTYNIKIFFKLVRDLNKANQIIIHGLFSKIIIVLLILQPWLLKKCCWVIWGGDLYYKRNFNNIKSRFFEKLKGLSIRFFGTIVSSDIYHYNSVLKIYGTRAKYKKGNYLSPINFELLDNYLNIVKTDSTINILLGNSADDENRHEEAFAFLEKFKEEDINIICPLSYGDKEYAKKIITIGIKTFGDKFTPITELLSKVEYADKILSIVDIAIMNHNRSQAMGNIKALLYLEKKVFLQNDFLKTYFKNNDLLVYDVNKINSLTFSEFCLLNKTRMILNNKNISDLLSVTKLVRLWRCVFS